MNERAELGIDQDVIGKTSVAIVTRVDEAHAPRRVVPMHWAMNMPGEHQRRRRGRAPHQTVGIAAVFLPRALRYRQSTGSGVNGPDIRGVRLCAIWAVSRDNETGNFTVLSVDNYGIAGEIAEPICGPPTFRAIIPQEIVVAAAETERVSEIAHPVGDPLDLFRRVNGVSEVEQIAGDDQQIVVRSGGAEPVEPAFIEVEIGDVKNRHEKS